VRLGRIIWDSFQANRTSMNFSVNCSNCREHPGLHAADLYMHVVDSFSSSVYGYFLLFYIVLQWAMNSFEI
jgi:hypothetical protein